MRVGLMTREYPPYVYGGAGVHVEYLSRELAKTIEVEVHAWGDTPDHDSLGPIPGANTPAVHAPHLDVHFENPWPAITNGTQAKFKGALEALSLNLLQNLRLDRLDIIHTHTWYVAMAGFLAKKLYNIPFVLTTHSLEPLRAWKAEQLGSGYALSSWMERTAILDADAIVAVSNGTKADILKAYPDVDEKKIHVIYNGIDLNQYQYTEKTDALTKYGVDPAKPYVLFVGRITRQKGVTHLVEAVPHLPAGTQVVLCAGAPDTPEIAQEMRTLVQKLTGVDVTAAPGEAASDKQPAVEVASDNVNNPPGHAAATGDPTGRGHNIVWIEQMVSKEEAIQLYSHCAVFCCPSVYEPFGIINLEAMACGAPVVASATGGILEVVVEGETGHLVPFEADPTTTFPTDPQKFSQDLATRIKELLAEPEKAKAMGKAGRKRVEDHFSWTAIAAQTIELYNSLITEKK
ncbi:glycosyltransferase family 4 protein [Granulicella paludicola]|uniref:glycosyltransferase family 4 protein n=1 Tax=Granulicella paludicola TaxID=474951 RepID=UPI0021DFE5BB|nr:glycosyltransferase family 4 protein [Granulicella paludicola]